MYFLCGVWSILLRYLKCLQTNFVLKCWCLWSSTVTRGAFLSDEWSCLVLWPYGQFGLNEGSPSGCISARPLFLCWKTKKKRQKQLKTINTNDLNQTQSEKCNILLVKFLNSVSCGGRDWPQIIWWRFVVKPTARKQLHKKYCNISHYDTSCISFMSEFLILLIPIILYY